jgi:hypothetical protein
VSALWLLKLYPRRWRERYGAELSEILAERSVTPVLLLDVALGALDAHTHPMLEPHPAGGRAWLRLDEVLRCRPTRGMLVAIVAYGVLVAGCGAAMASTSGSTSCIMRAMGLCPCSG